MAMLARNGKADKGNGNQADKRRKVASAMTGAPAAEPPPAKAPAAPAAETPAARQHGCGMRIWLTQKQKQTPKKKTMKPLKKMAGRQKRQEPSQQRKTWQTPTQRTQMKKPKKCGRQAAKAKQKAKPKPKARRSNWLKSSKMKMKPMQNTQYSSQDTVFSLNSKTKLD